MRNRVHEGFPRERGRERAVRRGFQEGESGIFCRITAMKKEERVVR